MGTIFISSDIGLVLQIENSSPHRGLDGLAPRDAGEPCRVFISE